MGVEVSIYENKGEATVTPSAGPIDQRMTTLGDALDLLSRLTVDIGANFEVTITHIGEDLVAISYEHYLGELPESNPDSCTEDHIYFFDYRFERDYSDESNEFERFVFMASSIASANPHICTREVLRRLAGDKQAYQPA